MCCLTVKSFKEPNSFKDPSITVITFRLIIRKPVPGSLEWATLFLFCPCVFDSPCILYCVRNASAHTLRDISRRLDRSLAYQWVATLQGLSRGGCYYSNPLYRAIDFEPPNPTSRITTPRPLRSRTVQILEFKPSGIGKLDLTGVPISSLRPIFEIHRRPPY